MSDREKQMTASEDENQFEYTSEADGEDQHLVPAQQAPQQGQRTMQRARQNRQANNPLPNPQYNASNQQMAQQQPDRVIENRGDRTYPIRESRIKDRPVPQETRDSSLKIKIELDLEVEVDLYARVKGDVTIGLL